MKYGILTSNMVGRARNQTMLIRQSRTISSYSSITTVRQTVDSLIAISHFLLLPKFYRIEQHKPNEKEYDQKVGLHFVSEFNRAQESNGKGTVGVMGYSATPVFCALIQ